MKPMLITRRSGSNAHWLHEALLCSKNILISPSVKRNMRVDRSQEEAQRDDAEDRARDRSEAVVFLEHEDPRHQCDTQHRQPDEQHDADREASIREPDQWKNILEQTQRHS